VPFLNAAFTDLEFNEYQKATDRMAELIRLAPPSNKVLLATAYMTWGAARMGGHDLKGADRMLESATRVNPDSATAFGLWGGSEAAPGRPGGCRAPRSLGAPSLGHDGELQRGWRRSISIFPGATINR